VSNALLVFAILFSVTVFGKEDPALDKRVMELAAELRCLVCQNQSIADSNADLAVDLRRQVREQLGSGKSEREVLDFMVQRYGDFVLYRPPLKASTVLLWGGPFLLLGLGMVLLVRRVRSTNRQVPPLSEAERARAAAFLDPGKE
jgi:cytochrome c-type biogenesis protein CcmH